MDIILKDNTILTWSINGIFTAEKDHKIMYTGVLKYKNNIVVTIYFSPWSTSDYSSYKDKNKNVIEIHIDTNERLVAKYKLPYYKHNVDEYYKQDKKYSTCKKQTKMKALDLGMGNLTLILNDIQTYIVLKTGTLYDHLFIGGRATGANCTSRKDRIIKIRSNNAQ